MRKSLLLALFILVFAPAALFAQTTSEPRGAEIFVGYSNLQSEGITGFPQQNVFNNDFFNNRTGLNGLNTSVTGYLSPRFGLTGEFSFYQRARDTQGNNTVVGTTGTFNNETRTRRFNFLGGPTVKFRNESRVEPFVHGLAGVANTRFRARSQNQTTGTTGTTTTERNFTTSSTDFTVAVGGGLDVKVGDRLAIRAIQVDYNPVFFRDRSINVLGGAGAVATNLEGQRADNFRFSFGVVF